MRIYDTRKLFEAGVLPAPAPTQDVAGLSTRLAALDFQFAAEALPELLTQAAKEGWGPSAFLDAMIRLELERREERRIRHALKIAGLPPGQTLAGFDFAFQPAVERSRIETLATCGWLREKSTLLIQGPSGVGKTHLAVGLGVKAIECGFSVCFYRLEDLLAELRKHADLPTERLKHKKYMASNLLTIDEVGFQAMKREEANLFFRVVSYRYGRGSICITTNKSIKDWPEMLAGDEALAMATLDRLLHSSHVLNIRGRSYRLRDLEESLKLQKKPSDQPDSRPVTEPVAAPS
jgi:DNA replication protein DnaC